MHGQAGCPGLEERIAGTFAAVHPAQAQLAALQSTVYGESIHIPPGRIMRIARPPRQLKLKWQPVVKGMVRVQRLLMGLQDLSKLKVEELTPLTPEVISRQATINIGKSLRHLRHDTGPAICAESALHESQDSHPSPAALFGTQPTNQQRSRQTNSGHAAD